MVVQVLDRLGDATSHGDWDVAADGSRLLIAIPVGADASAPFVILWNRLAQLRTAPRQHF